MKIKNTLLIVSVLISQTVSSAHAAENSAFYKSARATIMSNTELLSTIESIGLTADEAAEKFEEAEKEAKKKKFDLSLGTLALCGKVRIGLIVGLRGSICTTLSNSYSLVYHSIIVGGQMMAGVEAIYFRTAYRDTSKKYCYLGGGGSIGYLIAGDTSALVEYPCDYPKTPDNLGLNRGFLLQVSMGAGVGSDISADSAIITHLSSYWGH